MKWLLLMILLFSFTGLSIGQISQENYDKFILKFCDVIEENKERLRDKGWETESIAWGEGRRSCSRCYTKFWINMKQGTTYVFYTMTNGPRVRVCLARQNAYREPINKFCYGISNKIIWKHKSRRTEEYMYLIEPVSNREGVNKTYFTKLFRRKK